MDILQRLKRHLVMSKFATQQDLYAEMDADRRDAAEEIELLRRALDDLGVTPEEARAGALRSKERQNEVERLRSEVEQLRKDALKYKFLCAFHGETND